jgi:hypothetical protein
MGEPAEHEQPDEMPAGEPETPPEHPIVEPAPDEDGERDAEAEAPPQVEPALGFEEFLATHTMRPAAEAMLKAWMRRQGKDSAGHYPLAEWEADYQAMLTAS